MTRSHATNEPNRDHKPVILKDDKGRRTLVHEPKTRKPPADFVQVSRKYLDQLDELAFEAPAARRMLTALVKSMNRKNAVVISIDHLCKRTGQSRSTVKRSIAHLREQRWIDVKKVGTGNVYSVNNEVYWRARIDGKWASFGAEIVLDWEEQDEATKSGELGPLRHVEMIEEAEEVIVTNTQLGNDDPPEQSALDFHSDPPPVKASPRKVKRSVPGAPETQEQ